MTQNKKKQLIFTDQLFNNSLSQLFPQLLKTLNPLASFIDQCSASFFHFRIFVRKLVKGATVLIWIHL